MNRLKFVCNMTGIFFSAGLFLLIANLCMLNAYAENINDAAVKVAWGYKGNIAPERWGELSPAFSVCASGKEQSPIDVPNNVFQGGHLLKIHYRSAPMVILDDGNTELMIGGTKTLINDGHAVQLNFPSSTKESITLNGNNFRLVQFHIHTPSENTWHGESFPMEIHFVHQGADGELAVIGVFGKEGPAANPIIEKIIAHIPKEPGVAVSVPQEKINPQTLLPRKHENYQFNGSLTTPPCAEGVRWIVMAQPITLSPAQVKKLREEVDGSNARPTQSFNNRKISFNTSKG